jgi:hypothetical protein
VSKISYTGSQLKVFNKDVGAGFKQKFQLYLLRNMFGFNSCTSMLYFLDRIKMIGSAWLSLLERIGRDEIKKMTVTTYE